VVGVQKSYWGLLAWAFGFFFFFLINNVMSLKKRRRAQHKKYIKVQPKRPLSEQEVYKSTHKSRKQKCMN